MINFDEWQMKILETKGNLLLVSGRQVGKSTIIAKKAGDYAVKSNAQSVLIISSTERQAEELFLKCLNYLEESCHNLIKKGKDRPTRHIIKLKNNSIIRCLPTGMAGIGIRGFTINLLIADEAAFIPEEVWNSVTPMILTTGGDIWLVSTPHGRAGYFWRCYNDTNFTGFHIKSEEVIKNRPISSSWSQFQRDKAIEHLEREKKSMSSLEYAQEYMGEFIDELRQFFPDELIQKCMMLRRSSSFQSAGIYFLGVDVARMGDDEATFEIIDRTNRKNLLHIENIILKKIYLTEVTNKILELDRKYNFKAIYVDSGGIGVGVTDYLLENEQTRRKIIEINNRSRPIEYADNPKVKKLLKEDLYNNLLGLMERGEIKLLDDDEIFQSLKSVQYEYIIKSNSASTLRIFGAYTHIAEGLIRAAFCIKDKRLNIWVR